jgi:hypothetical protein
MSARLRISAAPAAAIAIVAMLAGPALAKEGAIAKLDTVVRRDAEPGSTLEIGWSIFMAVDGEMRPIFGSPTYVRLVSPDGTSTTEAAGHETSFESGHYRASIVVPAGGIGDLILGMRGEACYAGGGCQRADYVFRLNDDALVRGVPVPAARAAASATTSQVGAGAPVATSVAAPADPSSAVGAVGAVGGPLLPWLALGVAVAVVAGGAALLVARRRRSWMDAAGH